MVSDVLKQQSQGEHGEIPHSSRRSIERLRICVSLRSGGSSFRFTTRSIKSGIPAAVPVSTEARMVRDFWRGHTFT